MDVIKRMLDWAYHLPIILSLKRPKQDHNFELSLRYNEKETEKCFLLCLYSDSVYFTLFCFETVTM